jgi:hypothetical protein
MVICRDIDPEYFSDSIFQFSTLIISKVVIEKNDSNRKTTTERRKY